MAHRRSLRMPGGTTPVLTPGLRLRAEIELALEDLQQISGDDWPAMRRVNDALHGVLAYTAAIGETCQVAPAVQAVRAAGQCLEAGLAGEACASLADALSHLAESAAADPGNTQDHHRP
jgi:hypothetical protein